MNVDVRQRQFAFGQRGGRAEQLVTGDVWSCLAIVGIDRERGLIFMAHLDGPFLRVSSVEKVFNELRARASSTSNVELYEVSGIAPGMVKRGALVVAAAAFVIFGVCNGLWLGSVGAVACGGGVAFLFGRARRCALQVLTGLGFKQPRTLTAGDARGRRSRIHCRVNVSMRADAAAGVGPELWIPARPRGDPRFAVLKPPVETVAAAALRHRVWDFVRRHIGGWELTRAQHSV